MTVGFVGKMSDEYVEDGIPFLRSQDINPGRIDVGNLKFISPEFHSKIRKSSLSPGDVVVVRTGYPGTAAVVPDTLKVANCADLVIVRPGHCLDARFVAFLFNSPWGRARVAGHLVGAAQQHFNVRVAYNLELPIPPIDEQRRIASILGAYDDLIEVNRRRIAVLEAMARGLFEEWFVRFRFPGHNDIGEDLGSTTFGDLALEIRDAVSPADVAPDTPYVGLEHLPRRSTTLDSFGRADEVGSLKLRFQKGDVLFGKIRPYFHKAAWAPFEGVASSDAIVLRPRSQRTSALVAAIASSDGFVAEAVQTSNGTKMPRANSAVLRAFPVALPSVEVLDAFQAAIQPTLELAADLQRASHQLAAARDLLLPRLISGELTVDAAERETEAAAPASAETFRASKQGHRDAIAAADLTDDEAALIAAARIPAEQRYSLDDA